MSPPQFPLDTEYVLIGPHRVNPGRLSVSRTFGDIEAKSENWFDGAIVCEPDIKEFDIDSTVDFVVLGCDGIFDKLSNKQVINTIFKTAEKSVGNAHELTGECVESVLKMAAAQRTLDNITVVMV